MSHWAGVAAEFEYEGAPPRDVIEYIGRTVPGGTERDDRVRVYETTISAGQRIRDAGDTDSPGFLAWFIECVTYPFAKSLVWAELTIDIDDGPRYRYRWENGVLTKLRGILDA